MPLASGYHTGRQTDSESSSSEGDFVDSAALPAPSDSHRSASRHGSRHAPPTPSPLPLDGPEASPNIVSEDPSDDALILPDFVAEVESSASGQPATAVADGDLHSRATKSKKHKTSKTSSVDSASAKELLSGSRNDSGFSWSNDARPFAIFLAVAAGSALVWRFLKDKRSKRRQPTVRIGGKDGNPTVELPGHPGISLEFTIPIHSNPCGLVRAGPSDITFVYADVFLIEDDQLHPSKVDPESDDEIKSYASHHASALQHLTNAGYFGIGKARTPDHNLGLLGDVTDMACNPLAPQHVSGGVGGGCASAVGSGSVEFAIGTDHLAGIRVAAACCGTYGFRATHGAIDAEGASLICPSLEAIAWCANDAALMQQIGTALQAPGSVQYSSDVVRILICKDMFQGCHESMATVRSSFTSAARSWAGEDMVNQIPIIKVLADLVPSLSAFADEGTSVMEALVDAAEAIQVSEVGDADFVCDVDKVDDDTLAAAHRVATECRNAMKRALADGNILAMPTLPGPPPRRDASEDEIHAFEDQSLQWTVLAALSGAPVAVVPVILPGQPPLSMSLMGCHKTDIKLLEVAAKLAPLITTAVKAAALEGADAVQTIDDVSSSMQVEKEAEKQKLLLAKSKPRSRADPMPGHAEKDKGNAAFKEGDFKAAIDAYSQAIRCDVSNPIYYSNRAMAALKIMEFDQAERDCSAALTLERPHPQVKTLLRRGTARIGLGKIVAARADFTQVANLEPSNRQAKEELRMLKDMKDFTGEEPAVEGNMHYEGSL